MYYFVAARGVLLRTVMGEVLRVTETMEAPVPHVLDMTEGVVTAIRRTVNKTPTVRAAATAAAEQAAARAGATAAATAAATTTHDQNLGERHRGG